MRGSGTTHMITTATKHARAIHTPTCPPIVQGAEDAGDVERQGDLALPVAADRLAQQRVRSLVAHDQALQQEVGRGCAEQDDAVDRDRATVAKCVSPIQAVEAGNSDRQNSSRRFAQRIVPAT